MHPRRIRSECGIDARYGGERLQVEINEGARVLGKAAVRCNDRRHRLPDMADLAGCEDGLVGNGELVLDRLTPGLRRPVLHARDRREMRADVGAGHHRDDAGGGERAPGADGADARMRERAAHEGDMQHAGKIEIGNETATAEEQPPILAPRNRLPDERSCAHGHCSPQSGLVDASLPPACSRASASPMFAQAGQGEYHDGVRFP